MINMIRQMFRERPLERYDVEQFLASGSSQVDPSDPSDRLAYWLPYRAFDVPHGVFVNRDCIGIVLELTPQSGADQAMADALKGLYSIIPDFAGVQYTLFASPHVQETLRRYASMRRVDPDQSATLLRYGRDGRHENISRAMARRRFAFLNSGVMRTLVPGQPLMVRHFRHVFSVTLPGSLDDTMRMAELADLRDQLISSFKAAGFASRAWDADDLINWTADFTNAQRFYGKRSRIQYDAERMINDQCVGPDAYTNWLDPRRGVFTQAGDEAEHTVESRMMVVDKFPERSALWSMGALIGDMFHSGMQVPCPFTITLGTYVTDQRKEKASATVNSVKAEKDSTSDMAKLSPSMVDKADQWRATRAALNRGRKLLDAYMCVGVYGHPDDANRAQSTMRNIMYARGFDLKLAARRQQQYFFASLPMTLSSDMWGELKAQGQLSPKTSGNAIHLAPLIAEPRGTGTPVLLGLGRRGQLTSIDFWDNEFGGKNVAVVGATGSGKSTLLQELAESYYGCGAKIRVFEKGRSFERLTQRVGGQFVRFIHEARINVNPFSMVSDETIVDGEKVGGIDDDVAMLQPLLAKMAAPSSSLDPAVFATLATVIKEEYLKKGRTMTVSDVRARYDGGKLYPERSYDQRFQDLADMLAPWSKGGVYEHYFEGEATVNFENDWVVFELQDLEANPHLLGVVQMILLYKTTQEFLAERNRRKMFILDEAKETLAGHGNDDEASAKFLDKLYVRVRKYNGSAVTATQDVAHYYVSHFGRSIFNQSDFIFMGSQSETSIAAAAENKSFVMDEPLKRLLATLGGESGYFKEWYVHSKIYRGVIRLLLNPSKVLLLSNRAEDNNPLDEKIRRGMTVAQAIDALLADRGIKEPTL